MAIDWDELTLGKSVFVPCIDTTECIKQVRKITDKKGMILKVKAKVENKKYGVRFWRKE